MPTTEEKEMTHNASCSEENKQVENFSSCHPNPSIPQIYITLDDAPHSKVCEIIIKRIAKAFFEQQKTEESVDCAASTLFLCYEDIQHPDSMVVCCTAYFPILYFSTRFFFFPLILFFVNLKCS